MDYEILPSGFLFVVVIVLIVVITIYVLFLLNLQNLLKEIDYRNRQVEPIHVWRMFIPLFNIIYGFILYPKISDSVRSEFNSRNLSPDGDFGKSIGIAIPVLSIASNIPFIGSLCSIANLVCFIIYWSKTSKYKNALLSNPKSNGEFHIKDSDVIDDVTF